MAFDKSKTIRQAEKYLGSGKINQAIDEYLKVLKENPKDWNLMIQIADLYLKVNKQSEAIQYFQKVGDHYYTDGFFLKAIAIYKRINKLDPNLIEICTKLAELYMKQGLTMDAKSQLQMVAQYYVSRNDNRDAIQTYQRLIEIEPENIKTRNELARAYKTEGMVPEAIREYLEISDQLSRKSLLKESLGILETAYKLDPKNTSILRKILGLYTDQREIEKSIPLLQEALQTDPSNAEILGLLAESYAEQSQFDKAHETIDRAILNASRKEPFWLLKGDLYLEVGDLQNAFEQFSMVIERQLARREIDKAVLLLLKITRTDTGFIPAWEKLIEVYSKQRQQGNLVSAYLAIVEAFVSKNMYEEAARYQEALISLEPDDNQHREKLKFIRSFLKTTTPHEPFAAKPPEIAKEADKKQPVRKASAKDFDLDLHFNEELPPTPKISPPVVPPIAAGPHPIAMPGAAAVSGEEEKEFVSEHLIEAEVFNKYGLVDKAIEQLLLIIGKYPTSVVSHQKLKEIYLEKGERDRAVEECVTMSRIFRKQGDLDQAEDLLSEARRISPNHPGLDKAYKEMPSAARSTDIMGEIQKLAQSMKTKSGSFKIPQIISKSTSASGSASGEEPAVEEMEEIEIEIEEPEAGEGSKLVPQEDRLGKENFEEIDFYWSQGLKGDALKLLNELRLKHPDDPGVVERLQTMQEVEFHPTADEEISIDIEMEAGDEEIGKEEMMLEIPPDLQVTPPVISNPTAFSLPDEETLDLRDLPDLAAPQVSIDPELPEADIEALSREPRPIPIQLQETSEAEESVAPGESEVNQTVVQPVEASEAKEERQEEKQAEEAEGPPPIPVFDAGAVTEAAATKEQAEESVSVKAPGELFEEEDDFFDLAAELEEGLLNVQSAVEEEKPADGQNYSLEDILTDFKKGVEKQLGAEDYDTRYNLGIAYKEMGLIDEAIAEFQIAAKDPKKFLECCSMLGLCFIEKGMHKLAVKWYQRGLETEGYSEQEYQGLRFELAQAFEALEERETALETYQEVYGINASYRNVAKRIKNLEEQIRIQKSTKDAS